MSGVAEDKQQIDNYQEITCLASNINSPQSDTREGEGGTPQPSTGDELTDATQFSNNNTSQVEGAQLNASQEEKPSSEANISRSTEQIISQYHQQYHHRIIILGGGNAAGYAAREFVGKNGRHGQLCIITDEGVPSYERPALSKAYLKPTNAPKLPGFHCCVGDGGVPQDLGWYEKHGIQYILNCTIVKADLKEKKLTSSDGTIFTYEILIIATGARAIRLEDFRIPGADLKGLHYLRNIRDADALVDAMAQAKKLRKMNAVVIGGGYIGMEVLAALIANGFEPTMIHPHSKLINKLFTSDTSLFYQDMYRYYGAKFKKDNIVTQLTGEDGIVSSVQLMNGQQIPADIVVVGAGAKPNIDLFAGQLRLAPYNPRAGLSGGIEVDSYMQTSVDSVYAIGDVAAFTIQIYGGKVTRQEHVTHARQSAQHAISHILTPKITQLYDYTPYFYSRVLELSWVFYGTTDGARPVPWNEPHDQSIFGSLWISKKNKVMGVFMESGPPEQHEVFKQLVRQMPVIKSESYIQNNGFEALKSLLQNQQ